jgi:PKD repeat protein
VHAGGAGWDAEVSSLAVPGGGTIAFNPVLRRDWAAARGGAVVTDSNGREYTANGCGPSAAVDQSLGTAWSTQASGEKFLVVRLPETIDVTQFGLDPGEGCGDTAASATGAYLVETSPDGTAWTTAVNSVFTSAARHRLNFVTPTAGATGVRFVRLTLLSSQGFGAPFRDMSEFGVYGRVAGTDTVEPETTLEAGGPPFVFSSNEPGTFECRLDEGEWAACTSPHPVAAPDGEHTFAVRAVDAAGNRDASPATRTFVVDSTAPVTTLDAGGPPFTFSSNEAGIFECKLDAGEFAACASPFSPGVLADGSHTFSVRAVDAAGNRDATPEERTFVVDSTAPETGFVGLHPALTNDATPTFSFAASPPGATFECRLDAGEWAVCNSPHTTAALADGRHVFEVRAIGANPDPTPAAHTFRVDATAPVTAITTGPAVSVHSGPVAFGVGADEDATFECALDGGAFSSCATTYRAEDLSLGEHVFRARATDRAGNVDATPAERRFSVVNTAPTATLAFDRDTGPAPHTPTITVGATDADGDRLSYELDFGDGQQTSGSAPAALAHRYEATGTYTLRLTVRDARASTTAEATVTVTTPQPAPGLSLQLSATSVSLGTFVPGLTRDYTGTLTATTTGNGTLSVLDGGTSPGYLRSGTTALARPLEVRATTGAFTPLTSSVTIPTAVEFRQSIAAGDVLRPGTYAKALTFTLAPTMP